MIRERLVKVSKSFSELDGNVVQFRYWHTRELLYNLNWGILFVNQVIFFLLIENITKQPKNNFKIIFNLFEIFEMRYKICFSLKLQKLSHILWNNFIELSFWHFKYNYELSLYLMSDEFHMMLMKKLHKLLQIDDPKRYENAQIVKPAIKKAFKIYF